MKIEHRNVYICGCCDREYLTEKSCRAHEAEGAIETFVDELSMGRGGEWSQDMIRGALIENAEKWVVLLTAVIEARR